MSENDRENRTVIVHGPAGCGKTHHSKDLARALGCGEVIDGWGDLGRSNGFLPPVTPGALHLTNVDLSGPKYGLAPSVLVLSFDAAMSAAFCLGAV
ncbi:hypothetical protein [Pseudophaeobacter sp.]|jgi:SpoVK/Ycf46/Vps4 family AAA+-type ATPase|uniref:hypothetical protein n=1 Tax=Pseudophaeobacter sp. TaxID=1971739 RepID=UPI0032D8CBE5